MTGVVVYATRGALADAERLLPGRVLEPLVERAIALERVRRWAPPATGVELRPGERFVIVDSRVAAVVVREDLTPGGRRRFRVRRLLRLRGGRP